MCGAWRQGTFSEGAEGAGGMEYPTLYTSSDALSPSPVPWLFEERVSGVFTTVHEFGHQYFQLVAGTRQRRDLRTVACQSERRRPADAGAGAADESVPTGKRE